MRKAIILEDFMNTINSIIIEGNLVRDPMFKMTPSGAALCTFTLAANRNYVRNNETVKEVSFFDIETWSEMAKQCSQDGQKGRGVRVVGRLKQDRWKDSEGKMHSRIKVVADNVAFKPMKKKENAAAQESHASMEKTAVQEEVAEAIAF